jgi:hypothetical protein
MILSKVNFLSKKYLLIIFLFLFALIIRAYNINYDNLWFDEIASFWSTDPKISFKESFIRHDNIEQTPYLYFLILKINFSIFDYDSYYGRFLSLVFNILGIFFSTALIKKISNNSSYLLALFLFASNIFLIKYSQEMRLYSMIFFLASINLYLFYSLDKKKDFTKFSYKYFFIISIFQILLIISFPFCWIIFYSFVFYLFLKFLNRVPINRTLIISTLLTLVFSLFYILYTFLNLKSFHTWLIQVDLKFFTNFYFSKFFGSRLLGLIHLVLLISLILSYVLKYVLEKEIKINFIVIYITIIFLSYFLPITYGYIIEPILFPRYIIFVLIPIISLISILVFEIKNTLIKNSIIFLLIILNFGNHFTESTFKQFFNKRNYHKPNFTIMSKIITSSKNKNYFINMDMGSESKSEAYKAISNYISVINKNEINKPLYITKENFYNSSFKESWVICLPNVVTDKCAQNKTVFKKNFVLEEYAPGINIILISNEKK